MKFELSSARTMKGFRILLGLGAVLFAGLPASAVLGSECSPMTPCPCAADGTCHPKRDTWGSYQTRWRPWPGETVSKAPTPVEPGKEDTTGEQLPKYVLPSPQQEDLRGPVKRPKPAKPKDEPTEVPAEAPANPGPVDELPLDNFELRGFDPQSTNTIPEALPAVEDGPPRLPASLRNALAAGPTIAQPVSTNSSATISANRSSSSLVPAQSAVVATPQVVPASAVQPISAIQLTNPAAQSVFGPADDQLQQAVYYETTNSQ